MLGARHLRPGACRRRPQGLSIVELMVGVVVGLFVVGGSLSLYAKNAVGSRQLLLEARLNQDLRAAADLVARDLRRAGYWGNAIQGTIAVGTTAVTAVNPYSAMSNPTSAEVSYGFSLDSAENNLLDGGEQFGFRRTNGVLQMQTASGTWTDVTDATSLNVTGFSVTSINTTLPLGNLCFKPCVAGSPNCPTVLVRSYTIVLQAESTGNSALKRSIRSIIRPRNDQLSGACPVS